MITDEMISKKISEAIKQSGLKQVVIAQKLGVRQSMISHYVTGKRSPSLNTLANLCVILDLDANDILCVR